jgi:hypothetical protein
MDAPIPQPDTQSDSHVLIVLKVERMYAFVAPNVIQVGESAMQPLGYKKRQRTCPRSMQFWGSSSWNYVIPKCRHEAVASEAIYRAEARTNDVFSREMHERLEKRKKLANMVIATNPKHLEYCSAVP